jgi:hypothetical protein
MRRLIVAAGLAAAMLGVAQFAAGQDAAKGEETRVTIYNAHTGPAVDQNEYNRGGYRGHHELPGRRQPDRRHIHILQGG